MSRGITADKMARRLPELAPSPGLRRDDFTQIAKNGFGDAYNGIAHSAAYYQGRLYVGTSRCNLHMIGVNQPPSTRVWPVRMPANVYDLDRRAQIWRFDPAAPNWEQVYRSPVIMGRDGTEVAQDIGYRGMAVYKGPSDRKPMLYVCSWSPSKGRPPQLLRSGDGEAFERLGDLGGGGLSGQEVMFNTFRTLHVFNGKLFTAPTGMTRGYGQATDSSAQAVLWVTSDPVTHPWQLAAPPAFGDPTNLTIFEMAPFGDWLYAGTLNAASGYQIWKTRAEGEPPYTWHKVLDGGAGRGNLNEAAVSMTVFGDALYVGSGIQNGGYDKEHRIGPAGAELIRIWPDDSWDLLVGQPRDAAHGKRKPLADIGPGFDLQFNAHIWRGGVYDGWLYLGTYNWVVFLPYLTGERWPERFKRRIKKVGIDNLMSRHGGFDLWRSRDGVQWVPVSVDGFSNPYNYGIRQLVPTPHGLFLGTANTFGPEIALRVASGEWTFGRNPAGGVEIWLGRNADDPPEAAASELAEAPGAAEACAEATAAQKDIESGLSQQAIDLKKSYDVRMYEPLVEEYYDNSDFYSWGYWDENTKSQAQACGQMMEQLLSYAPVKGGRILDVACGKGATTKHVLRYWPPENIIGIDISDKLMDTCRRNAPGATFMIMDATNLKFDDESFETVLCVDGAALFDTRERFLREAYRVLKPGGRLIMTDRLTSRDAIRRLRTLNRENYVRNLDEYREMFERVGFEDVTIEDVSDRCLTGYSGSFSDFAIRKFQKKEIDLETFNALMVFILSRMLIIRYYIFLHATKPE